MNLIEELGGYEYLKMEYEETLPLVQKEYKSKSLEVIRKALLQYRRQHNIFEVGDKVIHKWENDELYTVMSHTKDHTVIISERNFIGISGGLHNCIRHATPEEIKAGRRL